MSQLLPLVTDYDEHVPAFFREFYYEEVQTLLYSNEVPPAQKPGFGLDDNQQTSQPNQPLHHHATIHEEPPYMPPAPEFDASTGQVQRTFFEKLWLHLKRVSVAAGTALSEEVEVVDLAEEVVCGQRLGALHASGPPALNDNPTGKCSYSKMW